MTFATDYSKNGLDMNFKITQVREDLDDHLNDGGPRYCQNVKSVVPDRFHELLRFTIITIDF